MQLDSSLAKQTQMKWLLNDFLGNPPRQRKPSIWSLLSPSLPPSLPPYPSRLCLPFSSPIISRFLTLISRHFSPRILLWFACSSRSFDLHCHTFFSLCKSPFPALPYLLAAVHAFSVMSSLLFTSLFRLFHYSDPDKNPFVKLLNRDFVSRLAPSLAKQLKTAVAELLHLSSGSERRTPSSVHSACSHRLLCQTFPRLFHRFISSFKKNMLALVGQYRKITR